jgi:hypothetical protein
MAERYIDHGCTLYPSAYMSTPASAAALPQEGDGKAPGTGAAPAVASASWDLSAASASSGTMTIMGATITGLTASGAALATAIASAINASTAVSTAGTGSVTSPYLRSLVWAAASGTTLTVYTRIASAELNYSANTACQMVTGTGWTSPPAAAQFSGGVSGPWASFMNTAALGSTISGSVGAAGTYGGAVSTVMGSVSAGDVIHVRTGRANANITVPVGSATTTYNFRSVGTASAYLEFRFDNGVVWNDGQSSGTFTIDKSLTGGHTYLYPNAYTWWHGQMRSGTLATSGGTVNCKIQSTYAETAGFTIVWYFTGSQPTGRHLVTEGVEFVDAGAGSVWAIKIAGRDEHTDMLRPARFVNCAFGHAVRNGSTRAFEYNYLFTTSVEAVDCLFAYGAHTYSAALISNANNNTLGTHAGIGVRLARPKFTGGNGGHHALANFATGSQYPAVISIDDPVDMGQFIASDSAASYCGRGTNARSGYVYANRDLGSGQFISNTVGYREFLHDTMQKVLEWRVAGFPTTGASLLPDGTPFSVRFSPVTSAAVGSVASRLTPIEGIKQVVVNTLGDAASLTLSERILIDTLYGGSAYTPTDAEWWIEGKYTAIDGSVKTFSTVGSGTALSADTTTWSTLAFAPFGGGVRNYARWKIEKTITNVKGGTDITLTLMCGKQPATMNEWAFVDPQFGVS